ncbi:MAG TPA: glutamate 5-kinase [Opitutaceae bacterium]|nr:glutamate 5-kinase [Opitutaceae bacterium]
MPSASPLPLPRPAAPPRRIIVKLGTGVLTSGDPSPAAAVDASGRSATPGVTINESRVGGICAQIAALRRQGTEIIVVTSGAIGLGMGRLGLTRRPRDLSQKQACAAIGQNLLMQTWQRGFDPHQLTVAQVLLTHDDLRIRNRYLAVKATLEHLLDYDVIPVINENDTVSAAEIRFGDNDTLSAMVASLMQAQYLVILSVAPGLIDLKGTGQVVPVVAKITPEIEAMAGGTTSETAVGGMASKVAAAKLATKSGCGVFIASGAAPGVLTDLFRGRSPGTFFVPSGLPMESRKRWLAYFQRPTGTVAVNAGAVQAVRDGGKSLLAVGVTGADGGFAADEIVNIAGPDGVVFARGMAAFAAEEIPAIAGRSSDELRARFPGRKHLEVVHRDNLVLL